MGKMHRLMLDWKEWKQESQEGRLCGILGCSNKPTVLCSHCGNHYCEEHSKIHFHVSNERGIS